jgi:tol-pal system protein YbgF
VKRSLFIFFMVIWGCGAGVVKEEELKDLQAQVIELNKATAALSRRVEELDNDLLILDGWVKDNYQALEEIKPLILKGKKSRVPSGKKGVVSPPVSRETVPSGPNELYRRSYDYYSSRRYQEAILNFRQFIKQFPQHELADNSQYWIGECYFDLKEYPGAIAEFQRVVNDFPEGNKVADALLKIGLAYAAMGDQESSRAFLMRVITEFPESEVARKAEVRLDRLSR